MKNAKKEISVWNMGEGKKEGSAVIGEVLVVIVVIAMAVIFKNGGLTFIQDMMSAVTTTATGMFS